MGGFGSQFQKRERFVFFLFFVCQCKLYVYTTIFPGFGTLTGESLAKHLLGDIYTLDTMCLDQAVVRNGMGNSFLDDVLLLAFYILIVTSNICSGSIS